MRAFVALEIPDNRVLDSLVSFQRDLAGTGADVKLVERENLHFTLKFLGEISELQAAEADRRLKSLSLSGGEVAVAGVGAFPNHRRPRVVWAGVRPKDEGTVAPIASSVVGALEGIGESDPRPFAAHVTLARVRSERNAGGLVALLESSSGKSFGGFRLASVRLKSSRLTPQGPVYSDLGVYQLR